jgi:outer membrane protein
MNKFSYFLILFVSCVFSQQALAELKIGFVNALQLMESAPQVEQANQRLEREFAPKQQGIVREQQAIRSLEERLTKNRAIMSEAEGRNLNRDIISKKRELKRQQDEFREDYNIRRNEELDKLQKRIIEIIQSVAREEAYDFILSDGVVWASKKVDITDKILMRLNQQGRGKR